MPEWLTTKLLREITGSFVKALLLVAPGARPIALRLLVSLNMLPKSAGDESRWVKALQTPVEVTNHMVVKPLFKPLDRRRVRLSPR
eukprot:6112168-Pyramimonas_sp.AAC.1